MVDQRRFDSQRWVGAEAAAELLGVQRRTLYAYVSRGLVRSVPGGEGRPRLYAMEDLERLRARHDARSGHGAVAAGALRWGEPVLDSAITAITPRGPAYRGRPALDLAGEVPFENVAELLWSGHLPSHAVEWPRPNLPIGRLAALALGDVRPLDAMSLVVQLAALADPARGDSRPDAFIPGGRHLVPLLAAALAPGLGPGRVVQALDAGRVAAVAARALGLGDAAVPALDAALVLLADHELNASSFAARVAASTGADPYACIAAALATLSGPRHGAASEAVAAFADGVRDPERAADAVRALREKQRHPPGFGHPLYPDGDPRAAPLLDAARGATNRRARTILALVDATSDVRPTVDVGLAALVAALGAPPAAAPGLFAVARSAGWLAHAAEQRSADFLLRPRARYVGPPVAPAR
jgi:citrate synthase